MSQRNWRLRGPNCVGRFHQTRQIGKNYFSRQRSVPNPQRVELASVEGFAAGYLPDAPVAGARRGGQVEVEAQELAAQELEAGCRHQPS